MVSKARVGSKVRKARKPGAYAMFVKANFAKAKAAVQRAHPGITTKDKKFFSYAAAEMSRMWKARKPSKARPGSKVRKASKGSKARKASKGSKVRKASKGSKARKASKGSKAAPLRKVVSKARVKLDSKVKAVSKVKQRLSRDKAQLKGVKTVRPATASRVRKDVAAARKVSKGIRVKSKVGKRKPRKNSINFIANAFAES